MLPAIDDVLLELNPPNVVMSNGTCKLAKDVSWHILRCVVGVKLIELLILGYELCEKRLKLPSGFETLIGSMEAIGDMRSTSKS